MVVILIFIILTIYCIITGYKYVETFSTSLYDDEDTDEIIKNYLTFENDLDQKNLDNIINKSLKDSVPFDIIDTNYTVISAETDKVYINQMCGETQQKKVNQQLYTIHNFTIPDNSAGKIFKININGILGSESKGINIESNQKIRIRPYIKLRYSTDNNALTKTYAFLDYYPDLDYNDNFGGFEHHDGQIHSTMNVNTKFGAK